MRDNRKVICAGCQNQYFLNTTSVYRKKRCCGKQECFSKIDTKITHSNYIKQKKKMENGTFRHGVPIAIKQDIYNRDGIDCKLCFNEIKEGDKQVHHIIPVSNQGTDDMNNLILLCRQCHLLVHKEGCEKFYNKFYSYIQEIEYKI